MDGLHALVARGAALFDGPLQRVCAAAVSGQQTRRIPYGAQRTVRVPLGTGTLLAKNDSRAQALRVYVSLAFPTTATALLGDGPQLGSSNLAVAFNTNNDTRSRQFVLRPDEQLFMSVTKSSLGDGKVPFTISQEWL